MKYTINLTEKKNNKTSKKVPFVHSLSDNAACSTKGWGKGKRENMYLGGRIFT